MDRGKGRGVRKETIGSATLILGDCSEALTELGPLGAIITDPPYAVPTVVAQGRTITRNVGDLSMAETALRFHARLWKSAVRETGRIFVFCDGTSYPSTFRATYDLFNLALLVWNKERIGMGREFRKSHELVLHGWGAETPIFSDGVGRPDVLTAAPVSASMRVHPAEKPVELLSELVRVCTGVICDPFMGSGSTGVAAITAGKPFVGIEINEGYFNVACNKIRAAVEGRVGEDKAPEAAREEARS